MLKCFYIKTNDNGSINQHNFLVDMERCKALFENTNKYNIDKNDDSFKILKKLTLEEKENSDYTPVLTSLYHMLLLDEKIPRSSKIKFAKDFLKIFHEESIRKLNNMNEQDELDSTISSEVVKRVESYGLKVFKK